MGDDDSYACSSNSSKSISHISFSSVPRIVPHYQLGSTPFCCSLFVFRNWESDLTTLATTTQSINRHTRFDDSRLKYNVVLWVVNQEVFFFEELRLSVHEVFLTYAILLFLCFGYVKSKKRTLLILFFGILLLQWEAHKSRVTNEATTAVWLMPAYNNTVLFYKNKKTLRVFSSEGMARNNRLVVEFQNEFSTDTVAIEGLKNSYILEDKTLFFIDSLWAESFDFKKQKNLLVLTKNTKVNLEAILLQNDVD